MANEQLGADIQHALAASAAALAVADAESLDSRRRASLAALVDGFVLVAADRRRRAAVALASTFASWRAAASAAAIASSSAAAFRLKTAARRTRNALLARRAHMLRQVLTQVLAHSSFSYMAHPTRSR